MKGPLSLCFLVFLLETQNASLIRGVAGARYWPLLLGVGQVAHLEGILVETNAARDIESRMTAQFFHDTNVRH